MRLQHQRTPNDMLLTRHVGTQGFRKSIVKRHQELLDAMRSGKEHVALAALESHLSESYEHVSQSYAHLSDAKSAHNRE